MTLTKRWLTTKPCSSQALTGRGSHITLQSQEMEVRKQKALLCEAIRSSVWVILHRTTKSKASGGLEVDSIMGVLRCWTQG